MCELRTWKPVVMKPPGFEKPVARPRARRPKSFFIIHKDVIRGALLAQIVISNHTFGLMKPNSHSRNNTCNAETAFAYDVLIRPQPKRLGAYRFGVSVRLSVRLSVCPSYFFVRARTFERKVIETWL